MARTLPKLTNLYDGISEVIDARPPFGLGYPSETTQSSYYPKNDVSESEIAMVSKVLEQNSIYPENTRLQKADNDTDYEVLLASVKSEGGTQLPLPENNGSVSSSPGDHSSDLQRVCAELVEASKYAANAHQREYLGAYIERFGSGSLDTHRMSQRIWVRDKAPRVENTFGFVKPYRDPHGTRAEFEALVGMSNGEETKLLAELVENSAAFIRQLPWAASEEYGKGPFEKSLFEPPDFSSIHSE